MWQLHNCWARVRVASSSTTFFQTPSPPWLFAFHRRHGHNFHNCPRLPQFRPTKTNSKLANCFNKVLPTCRLHGSFYLHLSPWSQYSHSTFIGEAIREAFDPKIHYLRISNEKNDLKSHLLLNLLLLAHGCNKKELKRPEGAGSPSNQNQSPISMDEEEVRKLAEYLPKNSRLNGRQGTSLATTTNENKDTLASPVPRLNSAPEVLDFYTPNFEHFTITNPSNLPENLKWESGADLEEFASPNAKRGGTFMEYMPDFPRTLRLLGPDGNGSCSYILDYNGFINRHPSRK